MANCADLSSVIATSPFASMRYGEARFPVIRASSYKSKPAREMQPSPFFD